MIASKFAPSRRGGEQRASVRNGLSRALHTALTVFLAGSLGAVASTPVNLQEALQAQRALVAKQPGDTELLNDLGNLLALAGRPLEAEETYRKALATSPTDVTSLYNLALVLREQGRSKEARQTFDAILEIDPQHAWTHYQLGTLHAEQGRRNHAVHHYAQAFAVDRSLTEPQVNPHIVENRLATEALLTMYVQESPSTQSPRLYKDPGDVADLLLPPAPPEPEPEPETAPEEFQTSLGRRYGAYYPATADEEAADEEGEVPDQAAPRTLDASTLRSREGGQTESATGSATDLGSSTSGTRYNNPPGFSQRDSTGGSPPPSPSFSSPPSGSSSGTAPSSDRVVAPGGFTPGLQSTGRLDLEWLPVEPTDPTDSAT